MLINITGNTSHSGLKKSDLSSREVLELHDTTTVTAWSTGFAIDVDKKRERGVTFPLHICIFNVDVRLLVAIYQGGW